LEGWKYMRKCTVAAVQMMMADDVKTNIDTADRLVREAAGMGANVILLPELFETRYFCQERDYSFYALATRVEDNAAIKHFKVVAGELGVVLPISFFEKGNNTAFNSVAIIDADGNILGIYRKTHIPDDHYYQEKFYFSPGDTGFKVWDTAFGRIGVGICWDQWFPECARTMALDGAELLLYPTAIGSEPILDCDSMGHWRRVMQGHAAANLMPVIAANRIGTETVVPTEGNGGQSSVLTFYGSSFITDETGGILESLDDRSAEGVIVRTFDLDELEQRRSSWGLFRDRRPQMYGGLLKL
jgi:N-carbamoylputrescine amidase